MSLSYDQAIARAFVARPGALHLAPAALAPSPPGACTVVPTGSRQGEAGTSPGINIAPGSNDDGWEVPRPAQLSDGTAVQLYKDGEALRAAFEAIAHAKHRVCLEVYIFRDDDTGQAFADLLAKKARQGVKVYVIYDSYGSLGSRNEPFDRMRSAGVRLAEFHPIKPWKCTHGWRLFNRDHRKLLVIDDDAGGLGGLNIGGEYAGSWVVRIRRKGGDDCPWRDSAVGLRGPSARNLLHAFARSWHYIHHGGRIGQAEVIRYDPGSELGILASVPTRRSPLVPFRRMIREARESILLTMSYFAPPDELIEDLCGAARRGVRVRLMLPGLCDIPLMILAARSFYETLLAAGVEVYERQHAILHAKTMCVDQHTTVIGSTNLDYRSIEMNLELSVVIRNDQFGRQMHDLFENDVHFARPITPNEWRTKPRPFLDNLIMWGTKRARYLL